MAEPFHAQIRKFLVETNAMSLALGVVIGGAVTKLIGTLVTGLIMPIVTLALPAGGEWRSWGSASAASRSPSARCSAPRSTS